MGTMAIIGTVTTLINAYRAGTLLATASTLGFNVALWANPMTWVAAGIAALVGGIILLALNWDTVTTKTKEFWDAIGGGSGAIALVLGPIGFLINAAIDLAKNWDSTKSVWENVWGAIQRSAATSVNAILGLINSMIDTINLIPFIEIEGVAKVDWGADLSQATVAANVPGTKRTGHYHGLANVPYDNYAADLHRGERVLTAQENKAYSGGSGGSVGGSNNPINITGNTFNVRQDSDIRSIALELAKQIRGGAALALRRVILAYSAFV